MKGLKGVKDEGWRVICTLHFDVREPNQIKNRIVQHGIGDSILKESNGNPKMFTVVHKADDSFQSIGTPADFVDGYIQPGMQSFPIL